LWVAPPIRYTPGADEHEDFDRHSDGPPAGDHGLAPFGRFVDYLVTTSVPPASERDGADPVRGATASSTDWSPAPVRRWARPRALRDLKSFGRLVCGLPRFLRHPISLPEAQAALRRRLAEREVSFLRVLELGVFGHARSPYRRLLELAGCELGDVRQLVRSRGLEPTLRVLREAGVYVSFEEFKGRTPIVRGGQVIPVRASDFDNPFLSRYYTSESGGTSGVGTRVLTDLEQMDMKASQLMVADHAHGLLDVPSAIWFGVLPDVGLNIVLTRARYGQVPERWFAHVVDGDVGPARSRRFSTRYIVALGRACGVPIPAPEPVPLERAAMVARWAVQAVERRGACMIRTQVSRGLRLALAAREEGLDLTGVAITGGGEPPTAGKVAEIMASGARWIPGYYTAEADAVGLGCANPVDGNDLHVLRDALALIQFSRAVPGWGVSVEAFCFTSVLPTAPKLMLNAESDDYGVLETRRCGCPLEEYGLTEHVREIRSFRKLTSEGVTLIGTDMVRILDEVLPARFGGSALDYQLLEEEDERGFTRLSLLVSPRVQIADESAVIATLLDALRPQGAAADLARAVWDKAGTWRVRRMDPIWTLRGKLMPLHLARRIGREQRGSAP
jgi:hypothetical protein